MTTAPPPPAPAEALRHALLADRARALTQLYRQGFPAVRRYIGRRGGSEQDAQDVFQDALVVLYEQATAGTLALTAAASTYLLSVSRNLWHHELRRRARLPHETLPDALDAPAMEEPSDAPALAVLDYVERLGERCKTLLLNFYYHQQPLAQLAAAQGYKSVRSATVQKYKCLERLRSAVRAVFATQEARY